MWKIALDIATRKIGYAIFKDKEWITSGVVVLSADPFSGDKILKDSRVINAFVLDIRKNIPENERENVILALEISLHANKGLGQKLSLYAGLFTQPLLLAKIGINQIKLITPREWQLPTFGKVLDRADGKALSIKKANEKTPKAIGNDDEADAINIAFIAEKLRDSLDVSKEKRARNEKYANTFKDVARIRGYVLTLREKAETRRAETITRIMTTPFGNKARVLDEYHVIADECYKDSLITEIKEKHFSALLSDSDKAQLEKYNSEIEKHEQYRVKYHSENLILKKGIKNG